MVEPLRVRDARLWFNATWRSAPNVDTSFRCQAPMGVRIPIIKSILDPLSVSTISDNRNPNIFIWSSNLQYSQPHLISQQNTEKREKLH